MGGTIYVLAGNVYNWQVQHNVLHHTYTNILGMMKILMQGRIIRFTKKQNGIIFMVSNIIRFFL
jgi:linoleoyl-CoA desaturase